MLLRFLLRSFPPTSLERYRAGGVAHGLVAAVLLFRPFFVPQPSNNSLPYPAIRGLYIHTSTKIHLGREGEVVLPGKHKKKQTTPSVPATHPPTVSELRTQTSHRPSVSVKRKSSAQSADDGYRRQQGANQKRKKEISRQTKLDWVGILAWLLYLEGDAQSSSELE